MAMVLNLYIGLFLNELFDAFDNNFFFFFVVITVEEQDDEKMETL